MPDRFYSKNPRFRLFMDILIVGLLIFSIYNADTARTANHKAAVVSIAAAKLTVQTAEVAKKTANLAYQNCLTLQEGRNTSNARNRNILRFVHFTARLNPGFDSTAPSAIAYFREANRLFGAKSDLKPPKCVNPNRVIEP